MATVVLMAVASLTALLPSLIPGVMAALDPVSVRAVPAYALVTGCVLATYLVFATMLVRVVDRRPITALGLRCDRRAVVALTAGVAASILVMLAASLAARTMGIGRTVDAATIEQSAPATAPLAAVLALLLLRSFVLQGIGEEVLFRGYLLQSLSGRPRLAVLVCAAAFTIPHLISNGGQEGALEHLAYLAPPFGFALSAAMLGIALHSVWAAIGIHGGFHVSVQLGAALGLMVDGPGTWLLLGAGHIVLAAVIVLVLPGTRWAEVAARGPYARSES